MKVDAQVAQKLEMLISSMGCEMLGYELRPEGGRLIFRIFIDTEGGVTSDQCSLVSRQVSALLDVEDPIQAKYNLEISSPGIDRPLFVLKHYQKFIGKKVKIKLHLPVNQRKQFKGILQRVEGEDIYLLLDDSEQEVKLPFSAIEKANLIGDIQI